MISLGKGPCILGSSGLGSLPSVVGVRSDSGFSPPDVDDRSDSDLSPSGVGDRSGGLGDRSSDDDDRFRFVPRAGCFLVGFDGRFFGSMTARSKEGIDKLGW